MTELYLGEYFSPCIYFNPLIILLQIPLSTLEFYSEMLEHVGHEFVDEFFCCCESVLAENGLLVMQVTSKIM
jgi:hypothetical protein